MDQSIFVFSVVVYCFSLPDQNLQSVVSDIGLYYLSLSNKKNASLIMGKYFCCICYSHQLYCFSVELDNDWIKSGFNHMNRHDVCHICDRNRYD